MKDADVLVIGSGAGGLTAAVALARAGKKVLVLEQHYLPGGWCHSFALDGYHFSPGVHYVGDLSPGGALRRTWEGLGLGADLELFELDAHGYDRVRVGDSTISLPKGRDALVASLAERFPADADGVRRYVDLCARVAGELDVLPTLASAPLRARLTAPLHARALLRWGLLPLARVVSAHVRDPVLRTVLCAQAGDHAMAPSKVPFALHAAIANHYFEGAWYPRGGGKAIPRALVRELRRHGGTIKLRQEVRRILVTEGRVTGVRLVDGTEFHAPVVISNADPAVTFGTLLPAEHAPPGLRRRAAKARWSISAVSLFLGIDGDPRAHGLTSGNLWFLRDTRLDAPFRWAEAEEPLDAGPVPAAFLTIPTLKDPTARRDGRHTAELFSLIGWRSFARWANSHPEHRPDDYLAHKERWRDTLLALVDELAPGLRDAVVFSDVGTPLTNVHYVAATRGSLYGTEKSLLQLGPFGFPVRTPLEGLVMCGASTTAHGVAGATMSGLQAAAAVLDAPPSALLSGQGPTLRLYDAETPSSWPTQPPSPDDT